MSYSINELLQQLIQKNGEKYIIAATVRVSNAYYAELPLDFSRYQREVFEKALSKEQPNKASSGVVWFMYNWAILDSTGWHYFAKPEIPHSLWKKDSLSLREIRDE